MEIDFNQKRWGSGVCLFLFAWLGLAKETAPIRLMPVPIGQVTIDGGILEWRVE